LETGTVPSDPNWFLCKLIVSKLDWAKPATNSYFPQSKLHYNYYSNCYNCIAIKQLEISSHKWITLFLTKIRMKIYLVPPTLPLSIHSYPTSAPVMVAVIQIPWARLNLELCLSMASDGGRAP
jgi:hypothetical protein